MQSDQTFDFPIKLNNGDGNTRAIVHVRRVMFKNDQDDEITVLWLNEYGEETEHCYFENLSADDKEYVTKSLELYDAKKVTEQL